MGRREWRGFKLRSGQHGNKKIRTQSTTGAEAGVKEKKAIKDRWTNLGETLLVYTERTEEGSKSRDIKKRGNGTGPEMRNRADKIETGGGVSSDTNRSGITQKKFTKQKIKNKKKKKKRKKKKIKKIKGKKGMSPKAGVKKG